MNNKKEIDEIEELEEKERSNNNNNKDIIESIEDSNNQQEQQEQQEKEEELEGDEINSQQSDQINNIQNNNNNNENTFIVTSPLPSTSTIIKRDSVFQKIKKRFPVFKPPRVRLLGNKKVSDSSELLSPRQLLPPVPSNYPSTEEFLIRVEYRKQRHIYGQQKVEYYLQQAQENNLNIDELTMKSAAGISFVDKM